MRMVPEAASARWEFSLDEYQRRLGAVRQRMAAQRIDCLLLTSEQNIRYLTGFHTQIWISATRPRYFLIPVEGEPIAVVPTADIPGIHSTSWITEIRSWPAPRPADDGVSLVTDALRVLVPSSGRIGAEIGPEARLGMPVVDFLRLRDALDKQTFVDAGPVLWPVRSLKSPLEISNIRTICQIASEALSRVPAFLRVGSSEREVARRLQITLLDLGADRAPYVVPISGPNGYDQAHMGPTDRLLQAGDLLFIDVGATSRGYFCDFDRHYALGEASAELRAAYARVYEATEAGLSAVRPGQTAADIWHAMAGVLGSGRGGDTVVGRMGHGLGLDITEPPSIAPSDSTILEEGMVLTIEPSLVLPTPGQLAVRLMLHEENVAVTPDGCEILTRRAPPTMPEI